MENLGISQNIFHKWFVLSKYIYEKRSYFTEESRCKFYSLFYDCFVYNKTDDEILEMTKSYIEKYNLKNNLAGKEYYWELFLENQKKRPSNFENWAVLYKMINNEMLPKEPPSIIEFVKNKYDEKEVEWNLNWNSELFD